MTLLSAALLVTSMLGAAAVEPSRLYFHAAGGLGGQVGTSIYTSSSKTSPTGTRDFQALSVDLVSTVAFRPSQLLAIGGQLHVNTFPFLNVTENRSQGPRTLTGVSYGISGIFGPSLTLFPGDFRFDVSPGFLWVITGPQAGRSQATLGGTGLGLGLAGGYDVPVTSTLAVALEVRLTSGFHLNSDSTHIIGFDAGLALMVGIRRR